jgi:hypothetical protein
VGNSVKWRLGDEELWQADEGDYDALTLSWHEDEMCIERTSKDDDAGANGDMKKSSKGCWKRETVAEHKGKVCSRCCVEKGPEGEVWCLGCLRAVEGD